MRGLKQWHCEGMALQFSGVWSAVRAQTVRRILLLLSAKMKTESSAEFFVYDGPSGRAV
jgi:hypothetical protein